MHLSSELFPCWHQPRAMLFQTWTSKWFLVSYFGYGHVEIDVEAQNRSRKKYDENSEGSVLKICHLHFHAAKFHPPSYPRVGRRRLETESLPICRLNILGRRGYSINRSCFNGTRHTSKWSLLEVSSWSMVSEKITRGSRMKRWDMCFDNKSSSPVDSL